ncbi:hypothetical protein [Helicobacter pylori]|uniref:hypothetical protein n=1 Tax=Helicobacter pylori TaxID=210 RepID=UPI001E5A9791|nr:hypothetical protein [Helicobacter pylori]
MIAKEKERNGKVGLLDLALDMIREGAIELKKITHVSPSRYKILAREYSNNKDLIVSFINDLSLKECCKDLTLFQRLYKANQSYAIKLIILIL